MRIGLATALAALLSFGAYAQAPQPVPGPRTPAAVAPPSAPTVAPVRPGTTGAAPTAAAPPATSAAGTKPATVAPAARTAAGPKIDINSATAAQLDSLPGIGTVRSAAIIAGRPYTDLQELVAKSILSQGVLDGAKATMALANINTSSQADLEKTLPGIGAVRAKAIVAGRPYAMPHDLVTKKVLTEGVFGKMKDLVAY